MLPEQRPGEQKKDVQVDTQNAHIVEVPILDVQRYKNLLTSPDVNVVYTNKEAPIWGNEIKEAVHALQEPFQFWYYGKDIAEMPDQLTESLSAFSWQSDAARVGFTQEVIDQARFIAELSGDNQPFVSLRTIDWRYFDPTKSSVSRDWHVDTSVLTLTTTFCGAGTEWTPDANVRRDAFRAHKIQVAGSSDQEYLVNPQLTQNFNTFSTSVLKGEIRQDESAESREFMQNFIQESEITPFNEGKGLIHRGPLLQANERRFLLTVSTFRVPDYMSSKS